MDEIEKVCTDVVILKFGVAIRQSGIEDIIGGARQIIVGARNLSEIEALLPSIEGVSLHKSNERQIVLDVSGDISTEQINKLFFDKGIVLSELREIKKSLEDQFLEITK